MNIDSIKQYSTYPPLSFDFVDDDGLPVDCSTYQVKLLVKNFKGQTVINSVIGEEGSSGIWLDEMNGIGEYQWEPEDTMKVGRFKYEFQFKRLYDNKTFKIPDQGYYEYGVMEGISE